MKTDDARVNILVFLGATALVFLALVAFSRYPSLFSRGKEYRAVFHNVAGINRGDEVRYGGLLVGAVTAMELDEKDPTHVIVRFSVRRNTPVRTDTRALITQVGMLGQPYLSLDAGSADAPPAPPGTTLASDENLSFQDAMSKLARFFERTDTLFGDLEKIRGAKNPLERLDQTLSRIDALVSNTADRSDRVIAQLEAASGQINSVLARTDRLITVLDTTVRGSAPGLATTQKEALATLVETRRLVSEIREGLKQQGGVDQLMRNLAVATDNLARLSTRIERDPTSVLQKRKPPVKTAGPRSK